MLSGNGKCIINDQSFEIKKGDTLAVPVFAWHQYFNTGEHRFEYWPIAHGRPWKIWGSC